MIGPPEIAIVLSTYAWVAWIALTLLLGMLYIATGFLGRAVFRRLTRIYHLTVVGYWLTRVEKEGLRVFTKADSYVDPDKTQG